MYRVLGMLLLATAIPLGGCATVQTINQASQIKVSRKQVFVLAEGFLIIEATATNYILLRTCHAGETFIKNRCSSREAVAKLVPVIRAGIVNRKAMLSYVAEHPNDSLGVAGLYSAVGGAAETIRVILKASGVAS